MFKKLIIVLICFVFITAACKLPTGPETDADNESISIKGIWDPYVGVHSFACDAGIQQPHLQKLIDVGALRGVRLGDFDNPESQRFANWFQSRGVEVLGLFDNKYLRDPNMYQIFSQLVAQNSGVVVWEIGNEVQGFDNMSSEEYMKIATSLFYYVKQNHPNIRLAIGAVAGNGSSADDLRRMIDAGLDKLCQDGLKIVPIHFYSWSSARLQEFKSQIDRLPISTRIWITETNTMPPNWNTQIGYVKTIYPKLRSALRAERIYWYVFSEDRDFCNGEFGLVKGLSDYPPVEYSPLMNILIGTDSTNSSDNSGVFPEILRGITPRLPDNVNHNSNKPARQNPRERRLR